MATSPEFAVLTIPTIWSSVSEPESAGPPEPESAPLLEPFEVEEPHAEAATDTAAANIATVSLRACFEIMVDRPREGGATLRRRRMYLRARPVAVTDFEERPERAAKGPMRPVSHPRETFLN